MHLKNKRENSKLILNHLAQNFQRGVAIKRLWSTLELTDTGLYETVSKLPTTRSRPVTCTSYTSKTLETKFLGCDSTI